MIIAVLIFFDRGITVWYITVQFLIIVYIINTYLFEMFQAEAFVLAIGIEFIIIQGFVTFLALGSWFRENWVIIHEFPLGPKLICIY